MFDGCYVALVTPFRDGAVDHDALTDLVHYVISGGVSGLVPCGTTGESPALTDAEQVDLIKTVVKAANQRVPVLAGTGSNCTAKTVSASQAAVDAGADAVMVVAPYYNKPNQAGLFAHYAAVAEAVTCPIVIYNIPGRSAVEISVDTIAQLHETHANIAAVKHATGSLNGASALAAACDIKILSGDDPLTIPLMSVGARGVISVIGNLLPHEMSSMVRAALAGDYAVARQWHARLFPTMQAMMGLDTNPIPIKTALAINGMMTEEFRLPITPMAPTQREQLETLLTTVASQDVRRSA